jgi:hypothetical protein
MITTAPQVYFKIFDYDNNKIVTSEDSDIEYEYMNGNLSVWRTKEITVMRGDCEADIETFDFINSFEILELKTEQECSPTKK